MAGMAVWYFLSALSGLQALREKKLRIWGPAKRWGSQRWCWQYEERGLGLDKEESKVIWANAGQQTKVLRAKFKRRVSELERQDVLPSECNLRCHRWSSFGYGKSPWHGYWVGAGWSLSRPDCSSEVVPAVKNYIHMQLYIDLSIQCWNYWG